MTVHPEGIDAVEGSGTLARLQQRLEAVALQLRTLISLVHLQVLVPPPLGGEPSEPIVAQPPADR